MGVGITNWRPQQHRDIGFYRPRLNLLYALLQNTYALAHLADTHLVPVIVVALLTYRYFKVKRS